MLYLLPHLSFSPRLLQCGGRGVLLLPLKGHQGHQFAAQPNLGSTSPSPPCNTTFRPDLLPTSLAASFPPLWDLRPPANLIVVGTQRDLRTQALTCFSSISSPLQCLNLAFIYILLIPNCFCPALNSRFTTNCLLTSPLECLTNTGDFIGAKEPLGIGTPHPLTPLCPIIG